jgi:pyrroline-5-carboxylate reductase
MAIRESIVRLGFIGTGSIASAVVEGFCTAGRPCSILLSPRNEQRGRSLEARFPQVRRAASNQDVLDQSDLVRPATEVYKVLPLPYAARRLGRVPFFPADAEIADLLGALGEPMPVRDERELHLLWAVTGLISPFYALLEVIQGWCAAGGADPETSKCYTASMYASLASLAEGKTGVGFDVLAREAATPGGLNQMALEMIREGSSFPDLRRALDAILERFGEPPVGN